MRYFLSLLMLVTCVVWTSPLCADGEVNDRSWTVQDKVDSNAPGAEATPNQASDASFDKRLPPVLPGERLNDSGREMRVWSSSGPVPVSDEPEPWGKNSGRGKTLDATTGNVGVIVDRRKD